MFWGKREYKVVFTRKVREKEGICPFLTALLNLLSKKKDIYSKSPINCLMETVTLPKAEVEQLHREIETLRNSSLYKRLLEFEKIISEGKKFTRADLGF